MNEEFVQIVEDINTSDPRYKKEAYIFVMEALSYTQKKFKSIKHVAAEELLEGMRELLINKFGPLAMTVLHHWGIRATEDFGNIVFHLIENKILCKTDQDNIDTFRNRYDFKEVFQEGYRKQLHKKISRMRTG